MLNTALRAIAAGLLCLGMTAANGANITPPPLTGSEPSSSAAHTAADTTKRTPHTTGTKTDTQAHQVRPIADTDTRPNPLTRSQQTVPQALRPDTASTPGKQNESNIQNTQPGNGAAEQGPVASNQTGQPASGTPDTSTDNTNTGQDENQGKDQPKTPATDDTNGQASGNETDKDTAKAAPKKTDQPSDSNPKGGLSKRGIGVRGGVCTVNTSTFRDCFGNGSDTSLADAVASVQGKLPTATFTSVDQAVTSLNLNAKGILSLEGIANLPNLVSLDLGYNRIKDTSPLVALQNTLQTLYLDHNQISDLTPINPNNATWPRLKWLDATGQSIHVTPTPGASTVTLGPAKWNVANSRWLGGRPGGYNCGDPAMKSPGARAPGALPCPAGGTSNTDGTYTWNDGGTHTYSWSNQGSYSNTSWTTAGGAGTFAYSGTITYSGYRVKFDPQNGQAPTYVWLSAFNLPVARPGTNPIKAGYTFTDWYTQPTGGDRWDFSTIVQDNITLYAHYDSIPLPMTGGIPNRVPTIIALAALALAGVTLTVRRVMEGRGLSGSQRPTASR
ncbi:InlB B-repeat-containing protein [Bifidobacterium aemilianum]|nr:InlB B-repeat-containing protein [Bifidobacterium aemilianum]